MLQFMFILFQVDNPGLFRIVMPDSKFNAALADFRIYPSDFLTQFFIAVHMNTPFSSIQNATAGPP